MKIDLHIHSSYSDGACTPLELVTMAKAVDLEVIAIADHDTVAGVDETISHSAQIGIRAIPAVELSVSFEDYQDIHLLGYGLNYRDTAFLRKLNSFRARREMRNSEILERINYLLINEGKNPIKISDVAVYSRDSLGRPHIARALLEQGYVTSIEDAFQRYLLPCNVPKSYWAIEDAINELHRIGAIAILAHPTSITRDHIQLESLITRLHKLKLDGIESYNNMAYAEDTEFLRRLASKLNMLTTCGSDFHGIEAGLEMGRGRGGILFSEHLITPLEQLTAGSVFSRQS